MDVLKFLSIILGTMILGAAFIVGLVAVTVLIIGLVLIGLYLIIQNIGTVLIVIGVLIGLLVLYAGGRTLKNHIESRGKNNV